MSLRLDAFYRPITNVILVQGSLELASRNFITGATKSVYAIIYSLILVINPSDRSFIGILTIADRDSA